ncbi:hypothetical protein BDQ94DRAFT_88794 [Aspergillus welwitschiae]|uniref:Uncharacterized protein n=1 Tax=Aspergillus welwitschiae TaxID=1341132 RepID=A0A3F3QDH9_9EURO|nr:hypothetical protein BDQ94DRAFT_88794 [Aspergillus welwitschiae]RDH37301.1 hypothetical protein BDQ94DRAFT_88794 [Aspergillus welwitschiae]
MPSLGYPKILFLLLCSYFIFGVLVLSRSGPGNCYPILLFWSKRTLWYNRRSPNHAMASKTARL